VIVAAAQIPAGTTGAVVAQSGLAIVQSVPQRNLPPGALTNLGSVDKKQLASDVYPGEVLIAAKFTDASQARTGALAIPDDKLAVSVQLDDPQRVAGFVVPGSQVAVFYTPNNQEGDTSQTGVILPRSLVIAVGPSTLQANGATGAGTQAAPTAILTLALNQRQAEMLVLAQQTGTLYLGLLSDKSDVKVGAPTTTAKLYH
jgi:pilus assembly protein CpaB